MKPFCFLLVVCCGAAMAAHGQTPDKKTQDFDWKIAQRFDDGRVVIMLSSDDAPITNDERPTVLGSKFDKPAPMFLAKHLDGLVRADADWGRRVTGANAGDRWAIDGGRAGWFDASISDFVVASSGCQESAAIMATVDGRGDSFSRVREKYFAARAFGAWTPPARPTNVGPMAYTVTDTQRHDIERLLQQAFQRESAKLLAELGTDRHLPAREPWRNTYARVTSGAARIRFDVQAFRLTPDALPRLFVRAVWNLDGQTVFMMSGWLRTAPALDFESVDLHTARFPWWGVFKYDGPLDPSMNGEILNVSDVDRDGFAELLMYYPYYESISMEVTKYPPAEPGGAQVIAKFGSGC